MLAVALALWLVLAASWMPRGNAVDLARMVVIGLPGPGLTAEALELIEAGVGGVILFNRNWVDLPQFLRLTRLLKARAQRPFLIGINHEGGRIQHLGPPFTQMPSMWTIGALNSTQVAADFGQVMGAELRAANIDINFAPVVDVNTNPLNPVIGDRSLGNDPDLVSRLGQPIVAGLQGAGVAACLKHFPGHGDTSVDSHLELPFVPLPLPQLHATHFKPFKEIIAGDPAPAAVMTSHIVFEALDPGHPATMSPAALKGLLREQFGFQGVIFSDSMEMNAIAKDGTAFEDAIVNAVNAGVDMFLVPHTLAWQQRALTALQDAYKTGRISTDRVQDANRRIDALFEKFVRYRVPLNEAAVVIGCEKHAKLRAAWVPPTVTAAGSATEWRGTEL